MTRAAFYLRVSTLDQNTDNQEIQLREVAVRAGYEITKIYRDHGIAGAKGRDKRPQFDALCKDAARRKFDLIMCWSVDRLGRSLTDLLEFLKEIHALRIDLYLHQQGLDTTTPSGKAMFQMMGVFAELERSLIRERVRAGLARAKASGFDWVAPGWRRKGDQDPRMLCQGVGIVRIGKTVGCGTGVVQRIEDGATEGAEPVTTRSMISSVDHSLNGFVGADLVLSRYTRTPTSIWTMHFWWPVRPAFSITSRAVRISSNIARLITGRERAYRSNAKSRSTSAVCALDLPDRHHEFPAGNPADRERSGLPGCTKHPGRPHHDHEET